MGELLFFQITSSIVFEICGRDSQRYLNARLSNDIKLLNPNRAILAAALTPQAKVEGLFTVLQATPESYTLICDGGDSPEIEKAIARYKVADRVSIEARTKDYSLIHVIGQPKNFPAFKAEFEVQKNGANIYISRQRLKALGIDLLLPVESVDQLKNVLRSQNYIELNEDSIKANRIEAGFALFPDEINIDHNICEAALPQAISSNKGCYVGQEVVEKINALGKPAMRLVAIAFQNQVELKSGTELIGSDDKRMGNIVSSAVSNGKTVAFAYVRNTGDLPNQYRDSRGNLASLITCA